MLGKKTGYVKDRAFYNDSNIENFQVKSDLYEVGFECFWNCKKMTEIQLGNKLETVGYSAFSGSGITSIEIPETATSWGQSDWNYHFKE